MEKELITKLENSIKKIVAMISQLLAKAKKKTLEVLFKAMMAQVEKEVDLLEKIDAILKEEKKEPRDRRINEPTVL